MFPESVLNLAPLVKGCLDFILNLVTFGINVVQLGKIAILLLVKVGNLVLNVGKRSLQGFALGVQGIQLLSQFVRRFFFRIKRILLRSKCFNDLAGLLEARNLVDDPLFLNELNISAFELLFKLPDLTINLGERFELEFVFDVPDFVRLRASESSIRCVL